MKLLSAHPKKSHLFNMFTNIISEVSHETLGTFWTKHWREIGDKKNNICVLTTHYANSQILNKDGLQHEFKLYLPYDNKKANNCTLCFLTLLTVRLFISYNVISSWLCNDAFLVSPQNVLLSCSLLLATTCLIISSIVYLFFLNHLLTLLISPSYDLCLSSLILIYKCECELVPPFLILNVLSILVNYWIQLYIQCTILLGRLQNR